MKLAVPFLALSLVLGCANGAPPPTDRDPGEDAGPPDPGPCTVDLDCHDEIFCTTDRCEAGDCTHTPDDLRCAPGEACDPGMDCVLGPPCTTDLDCDDSLYCNGAETCDPATGCAPGEIPDCNDGVECTLDACDEGTDSCTFAPDHTLCSNGAPCDGEETCDAVAGCVSGAGPLDCNDGIVCTRDTCSDGAGGCVHEPMDGACDDGMNCNGLERCRGGAGCEAGAPMDCSDGVACTTDSCVEPGMCRHGTSDADMDGFVAVGCGMGNDCDDTVPAVHPGAAEICNGVDDDCVGGVDTAPGFECALGSDARACMTGCGTAGTRGCNVACRLGPCVAAAESCNDCDDDGDGEIDDGLACRRGTSVACTTGCGTAGTRTCAADCSGLGPCVGAEVCNGCDDDGDGTRDDGVGACPSSATEVCTTGSGVVGMRTCAADCSGFGACIAGEVCNGLDDDGDGDPDDGFPCVRGTVQPCTTACMTMGSRTCDATCTFPACAAGEVCGNACDDDADGAVDELCNDLCAAAAPLMPASGGTLMGTTTGAAREVTDCGPATGTPGGEVFYSITVAVRSVIYFDTFGTTYDTTLSLRPTCGAATTLCEDDDCATLQDQLVTVVAPGTYLLAVHARRTTATGPFRLRWQSFAVPTNGTPTRITANGTITGMTAGTASGWTSCDGTGVENFHYLTLCTGMRTITASTCASTWDTVVSIADGTVRACEDDSCGTRSTTTASVSGPGAVAVIVDSFSCCGTNPYSLAISGL